jgi:hypothetical protein
LVPEGSRRVPARTVQRTVVVPTRALLAVTGMALGQRACVCFRPPGVRHPLDASLHCTFPAFKLADPSQLPAAARTLRGQSAMPHA